MKQQDNQDKKTAGDKKITYPLYPPKYPDFGMGYDEASPSEYPFQQIVEQHSNDEYYPPQLQDCYSVTLLRHAGQPRRTPFQSCRH